jgi:hypothetical protein
VYRIQHTGTELLEILYYHILYALNYVDQLNRIPATSLLNEPSIAEIELE